MDKLMYNAEFSEEITKLKKQYKQERFIKIWRFTESQFQLGRLCKIVAEPDNVGIFVSNLPSQTTQNQGYYAEYHQQKHRLGPLARPDMLEPLLNADFIELLKKNLQNIELAIKND